MKSVCVFLGSSPGRRPEYAAAAAELGRALAQRGLTLVYGGSSVGLMDVLANAALAAGGKVIGVAPTWLIERRIAHQGLSELRVVDTMHARKQQMAELSDAVIALPGGLGTLEEFFEALTWGQLGLHEKPCGLLDVCGYYRKLMEFLDQTVAERFVTTGHRSMLHVTESPEELLDRFAEYRPPEMEKWIDRSP